MPGVVAAGQRETAEAAAQILERGGNAVDAAIAACAAAFMAEPLLCSAGGGGIMTLALPGQAPTVIDFFSDTPGRGLPPGPSPDLDFVGMVIDFGGLAEQTFHLGRGSAATPGALPGLALAHERYGSLPLSALMEPAITLASEGVTVSAETAHVYGLLWSFLTRDPETLRVLAGGSPPRRGDVLRNPDLAETLRAFASLGRTPPALLDGLVDAFGPARGGLITPEDIRAYEPRVRTPVIEPLGQYRICLPPSPGGRLASLVTRELAQGTPAPEQAGEILRYAQASRYAHEHRGEAVAQATTPGSTTHISVIDAHAGAAAVTLTNGEGCGHLVPGTGVQVNNFLGEEDLNPDGFHLHRPGVRLPTMIAPCVVLRGDQPCMALGSGGSNRIRSAVGQAVYRRLVQGLSLADAVAAPRVHAETHAVWFEAAECADPAAVTAALAAEFPTVMPFPERDFFFGGVHAVEIDQRGVRHGVGDARRGGVAVDVPDPA